MSISKELIKHMMVYPTYEAKKKNEVDLLTFMKKKSLRHITLCNYI